MAMSHSHLQDCNGPVQSSQKHFKRRAAVIGGGPSGIQAAGELMKRNFQVTIFERHSQLGGIWCYDKNEHISQPRPFHGVKPFLPLEVSAVYKNMKTTLLYQSMSIDGFPIPRPDDLRFVHRSEILDYLNTYARHLDQKYPDMIEYRFNSTVESVTHDDGWSVISLESNKSIHGKFDVVVVATGAFHKPTGANLHDPEFKGVCFHSLYYDDPSVLDNRTVLIIGGGNSAKDIFWDAMEHAKNVVLASPNEQARNNVVLPVDHYSTIQEKFTSVGRVKHIQKDGVIIHTNWNGEEEVSALEVDMVIYCTGYKREFPFLPEELQPASRAADGSELTNCFLFTAQKDYPNSLFFFHPSKTRTTINSMARETQAQARLMASFADREIFTIEQLEILDDTLCNWFSILYEEWSKELLTSCECFVQNTLLMNYLNSVVESADALSNMENIRSGVMDFVRSRMKEKKCRKHNTIWQAGLELRQRADAVNWNQFRSLRGKLVAGPDVDGSEFYAITWFLEDNSKHSTYHEYEIKYEDLILNG